MAHRYRDHSAGHSRGGHSAGDQLIHSGNTDGDFGGREDAGMKETARPLPNFNQSGDYKHDNDHKAANDPLDHE